MPGGTLVVVDGCWLSLHCRGASFSPSSADWIGALRAPRPPRRPPVFGAVSDFAEETLSQKASSALSRSAASELCTSAPPPSDIGDAGSMLPPSAAAAAAAPVPGQQLLKAAKTAPAGSWKCEVCLVVNQPSATYCPCCETPRPGFKAPTKSFVSSLFGGGGTQSKSDTTSQLFSAAATTTQQQQTATTTAGTEGSIASGHSLLSNTESLFARGAVKSSSFAVHDQTASKSTPPTSSTSSWDPAVLFGSAANYAQRLADVKVTPEPALPAKSSCGPVESSSSQRSSSQPAAAAKAEGPSSQSIVPPVIFAGDRSAAAATPVFGSPPTPFGAKTTIAADIAALEARVTSGVDAADGTVYIWGSGECDQMPFDADALDDFGSLRNPLPVPQLSGSRVRLIACGAMHTVVVTDDNRVLTWGCNDNAALGRNTAAAVEEPRPKSLNAQNDDGDEEEEQSASETLGRDDMRGDEADPHDDDDVDSKDPTQESPSMGDGPSEDAPNGSESPPENEPGVVENIAADASRIESVSCGDSHTALTTASGRVYCWGSYSDFTGPIGFPLPSGEVVVRKPAAVWMSHVPGAAKKVVSGENHTVVLSAVEGGKLQVFCWGSNEFGQLGRPILTGVEGEEQTSARRKEFLEVRPLPAPPGADVSNVFCGSAATFVCTADNKLWACGRNCVGELGRGTFTECEWELSAVEGLDGVEIEELVGCQYAVLALSKAGDVYVWGKKDYLGLGDLLKNHLARPQKIELLSGKVRKIGRGGDTLYAITKAGLALAWGEGSNYQIGDGSDHIDAVTQPHPINPSQHFQGCAVLAIGGGSQHSAALVGTMPTQRAKRMRRETEDESSGTPAGKHPRRAGGTEEAAQVASTDDFGDNLDGSPIVDVEDTAHVHLDELSPEPRAAVAAHQQQLKPLTRPHKPPPVSSSMSDDEGPPPLLAHRTPRKAALVANAALKAAPTGVARAVRSKAPEAPAAAAGPAPAAAASSSPPRKGDGKVKKKEPVQEDADVGVPAGGGRPQRAVRKKQESKEPAEASLLDASGRKASSSKPPPPVVAAKGTEKRPSRKATAAAASETTQAASLPPKRSTRSTRKK